MTIMTFWGHISNQSECPLPKISNFFEKSCWICARND